MKEQYTISKLLKDIEKVKIPTAPKLNDYLAGQGNHAFVQIQRALEIIKEYNTGNRIYDTALVAQDAAILGAIHANVSEQVGYIQGLSSRAEVVRKVVKSSYAMSIKKARDIAVEEGENVRVSENDIDHASRVLSIDAYTAKTDAETVSRMLSAAWYAIGDFTKILNSVIYRANREDSS